MVAAVVSVTWVVAVVVSQLLVGGAWRCAAKCAQTFAAPTSDTLASVSEVDLLARAPTWSQQRSSSLAQ